MALSLIMRGAHELVRSFYDDLWNCWDDALVDDVLSPDFAFRGSLGTSTAGRDGWRAYRDTIRAGSSDFHNQVVTVVCEGGSAAARLLYSGTHTGPAARPAGHRPPVRVRRRGVLRRRGRAALARGCWVTSRGCAVSSADGPLGDGRLMTHPAPL